MAGKKDMRRSDLIIPFIEPEGEKTQDMTSTIAQSIPMAAMFSRQKMIGWVGIVFATQNWLAETPDQRKTASTPSYLSLMMAVMSLVVCYMPLFMPPPPQKGGAASPAGADAPTPLPR